MGQPISLHGTYNNVNPDLPQFSVRKTSTATLNSATRPDVLLLHRHGLWCWMIHVVENLYRRPPTLWAVVPAVSTHSNHESQGILLHRVRCTRAHAAVDNTAGSHQYSRHLIGRLAASRLAAATTASKPADGDVIACLSRHHCDSTRASKTLQHRGTP